MMPACSTCVKNLLPLKIFFSFCNRERALSYTVRVYFHRFFCMCTRVFPCEFIYIFFTLILDYFFLSLCIHIHHPQTFFVNKKKINFCHFCRFWVCSSEERKKIKAKSHYVHFLKYANDGIGRERKKLPNQT